MEDINIQTVVDLQKELTDKWHSEEPEITKEGFLAYVQGNHMKNFLLWHEEDCARRDDKGYEYVYRAKRAIDGFNQKRNNYMEKIDEYLHSMYGPFPEGCPMNTESPGAITDRLSILALKEYHMGEETLRKDVSEEHIESCKKKLTVIRKQLDDLKNGYEEFLGAIKGGKRGFRVYYQFKMYNDPKLNPQLYKNETANA